MRVIPTRAAMQSVELPNEVRRTSRYFDIITTSNFGNMNTFTGRYFDQETGLHYFRARYFDSKLNTFISRDPLGYVDGASMYIGYFTNGMGLDPSGLRNFSNAEKKTIIDKLGKQSNFYRKKGVENEQQHYIDYADNLDKVIEQLKKDIDTVPTDTRDPGELTIGLKALHIWIDSKKTKNYVEKNVPKCNQYVSDVVESSGYSTNYRRVGSHIRGTRLVGAGEWFSDHFFYSHYRHPLNPFFTKTMKFRSTLRYKSDGDLGAKKRELKHHTPTITYGQYYINSKTKPLDPVFGDIVAFKSHVGIYIGYGMYVSATAESPFNGPTETNEVLINTVTYNKDVHFVKCKCKK